MNTSQSEEIKNKIIEQIEKTKKSIERFKDMAAPVSPDDAIGRISRMDAINNKSVAEASLKKAKITLQQLEYMLGKVDDKDFGLCEKCKKEIPLGRLLLMPQSRFCVSCAR